MLLPSAFDCAPSAQPTHPSYSAPRPKLAPPPQPQPSNPKLHTRHPSTSSNIHSTCRALQSLLTSNISSCTITKSIPSTTNAPSLASPIALQCATTQRKKSVGWGDEVVRRPCQTIVTSESAPMRTNKRKRTHSSSVTLTPTTPKRPRLHPPNLPLGLLPADFTALQAHASAIPLPETPAALVTDQNQKENQVAASAPLSVNSPLVAMLLDKLRLRGGEWECGMERGKRGDEAEEGLGGERMW